MEETHGDVKGGAAPALERERAAQGNARRRGDVEHVGVHKLVLLLGGDFSSELNFHSKYFE